MLADLIVTSVVATAEQVVHARPDAEDRIVDRARTQLRMVLVGALNWRSRRPECPSLRTMGLAADLDYHHSSANPAQRACRWLGGTRAGGWFFSRTLRHLDDLVGRLSGGRHSAPGLLTGIAVLDLTTTGRKSGQRRTSHLIATPYAGDLALLGTNFGQEQHARLGAQPRGRAAGDRDLPRQQPRRGRATGDRRRGGGGLRARLDLLRRLPQLPAAGRRAAPDPGLRARARRLSRQRGLIERSGTVASSPRSSTPRIASATVSGRIHWSAS